MFSIFADKEILPVFVFGSAAAAMLIVAVAPGSTLKFLGMNLFEVSVGMYFPVMGTLKGAIVPESKRAAIYNLYRIPLNFIVLFSLLTDLTPTTSFLLNFTMLSVATGLMYVLVKRRGHGQGAESPERLGETEKLVEQAENEV
jgi:hypothetical protein